MTLIQRINLLAQSIAGDIKSLFSNQGTLSSLNTTNKANLVAAINEVKAGNIAFTLSINIVSDGIKTVYSIPHGLAYKPTTILFCSNSSSLNQQIFQYANADTTNINLYFSIPPTITTTNNITGSLIIR